MPRQTITDQILVGGKWRRASADGHIESVDPRSGNTLGRYPVSDWSDLDAAIELGGTAYREIQQAGPVATANFLRTFADSIEDRRVELVEAAARETALDARPRLEEIELPRTTDQLRQAARVCAARSWTEPTICTQHNISSMFRPLPGPVVVLGPNNFPFAFNGVAGGDAAAALATGHPVIAKANPGHPRTTALLAEAALDAAHAADFPDSAIQMIYAMSTDDGFRLVSDRRLAAVAFTGSRTAGLALKRAADSSGVPIYLEMASLNPVVVLPGAIANQGAQTIEDLSTSLLMGAGQFCTSPGLIFVVGGARSQQFARQVGVRVSEAGPSTMLSDNVHAQLDHITDRWLAAGASRVCGGERGARTREADICTVDGETFAKSPDTFTEEAFGNAALLIECRSVADIVERLRLLPGSLTGTILCDLSADGASVGPVQRTLEEFVGRVLINKTPTGVAVCSAMNHGGPYPASGHPGFTAVGMPASLRRFAMLQAFDNVPDELLPEELQQANPLALQRRVDNRWTEAALAT